MPPSTPVTSRELVEFSVEDAMLNTWVEDTGVYLSLDPPASDARPAENGTSDQS